MPPRRSEAPTPRPGPAIRSVRDLRRSQILAAARTIVARDGLDALTIGALEKGLDFTRGVITYHFRDKDEIVEAVLESAVVEIDASTYAEVEAHLDLAERIEAVLRTKVRGFLEHPEATHILLTIWSRVRHDRRSRSRNAKLYRRYREESARLLKCGPGLATALVGAVIGIVVQSYFDPGDVDVDASIREAAAAIALRTRSPAPGSGSSPRR